MQTTVVYTAKMLDVWHSGSYDDAIHAYNIITTPFFRTQQIFYTQNPIEKPKLRFRKGYIY